jgi:hypothetical protein
MGWFPLLVGLFCNCVLCCCEGNNACSAVAVARSLTRLSRSVRYQPEIGGKCEGNFRQYIDTDGCLV